MSYVALSLQSANGSDILLQTQEWLPPARSLVAVSSFRKTRLAFAASKQQQQQQKQKKDHSDSFADSIASLDDDIAKMVHSALDIENKIRSAESWRGVEALAVEHEAGIAAFNNTTFELPLETISAGDGGGGELSAGGAE